nr:hypothetical protein CFP56_38585 [Quercus suber]
MSSVMLVQMAECIEMPQKAWVEAEKTGKSLSMPLMNIALPIQVARCTMTPQEDCNEAEKARECLLVSLMSVVMPTQVVHCPAKPQKDYSDTKKDEDSSSVSWMSIELPKNVTQCIQKFLKKVESVICDRTCTFGCKLNGGTILTVLWSLNLILLRRLVSPSLFDFLMGLSRAAILGLGDMGGEENAVYLADSLSLFGISFSAADAMFLSVGIG